MSNIPVKDREKARKLIERAIEDNMKESPPSVNEIAHLTGYYPSLVHRVYLDLGWAHEGGRWVWRHNPPKGEA